VRRFIAAFGFVFVMIFGCPPFLGKSDTTTENEKKTKAAMNRRTPKKKTKAAMNRRTPKIRELIMKSWFYGIMSFTVDGWLLSR